jgi:hypothetical protein
MTIISEPDPTEVIPTINPPKAPILQGCARPGALEQHHAEKGARQRSDHEPFHQPALDGAVPQVHAAAYRFHDHRGHHVA